MEPDLSKMITTEQWRQRIGAFCPRAQTPKSKKWRVSTLTPNRHTISLVTKLFVLTAVLMMAGDVESNPGPSNAELLKEIKAFRQENENQLKDMREEISTFKHELQSVKTEISWLKDTLHSHKKDIDGIYDECYGAIKSLKNRVDQLEKINTQGSQIGHTNNVLDKLDSLEGFSRRNNLLFHGIPGNAAAESSGDCEKLLRETLSEHLDLDMSSISFDRVHRLNTSKTPQPIIARLTNIKDKQNLLCKRTQLKGTSIYINEDFTYKVREIRNKVVAIHQCNS